MACKDHHWWVPGPRVKSTASNDAKLQTFPHFQFGYDVTVYSLLGRLQTRELFTMCVKICTQVNKTAVLTLIFMSGLKHLTSKLRVKRSSVFNIAGNLKTPARSSQAPPPNTHTHTRPTIYKSGYPIESAQHLKCTFILPTQLYPLQPRTWTFNKLLQPNLDHIFLRHPCLLQGVKASNFSSLRLKGCVHPPYFFADLTPPFIPKDPPIQSLLAGLLIRLCVRRFCVQTTVLNTRV